MNALEESLRSSSDHAGDGTPSDVSSTVERQPQAAAAAGGHSIEARLLRRLLAYVGDPPVEFVLWNGERVSGARADVVARVRILDRSTLYGLLKDPQVRFGDAYSEGRILIEGDLVRFMEEIYRSSASIAAPASRLRRLVGKLHRPRANSLAGSRENIHRHYDIGNDFYALWLGRTMAYTCAYFPTAATTLDEAQVAKMDHVCRKLRLQPGETVVEAGFGWGSLALHMARHYGVKVRAFNIAREQVVFARERAQEQGLSSQVEFVEDDYRNISGQYDAFVSVGMLEHVGVENYPELGRVAHHSLRTHGRGLIHSIGRNSPASLHPWIERRIFPGACPPSLGQMMQIFEPWDLSILDVENLRLHYARTVTHWMELFEANRERVRTMFDEKFVRMWRLYLAGSIGAFTTGTLQLFQVVFAPRDNHDVPMTRAHLYPG